MAWFRSWAETSDGSRPTSAQAPAGAAADEVLAHVKVIDLPKALPRVGDKRATLVMERYDIAANRRIRGLGRHQLAGLKAEFGER